MCSEGRARGCASLLARLCLHSAPAPASSVRRCRTTAQAEHEDASHLDVLWKPDQLLLTLLLASVPKAVHCRCDGADIDDSVNYSAGLFPFMSPKAVERQRFQEAGFRESSFLGSTASGCWRKYGSCVNHFFG